MGVNVGTATGYLDLDISGFLSGLRTAQAEAQKTTDSVAKQIGNGFLGVGKSLTSAGTTLTKSVTTPIVGLGTAIIKTSADFESSMSKVKAISGASGEDFDKLNVKAREMGASTKFSASEAASAFQYMAMAGWDVDNMLGGISGVMNLAAASGEDLASVSDIVTDAMTAFGLSADGTSRVLKDGLMTEVDNTTRFVDALAAASNSSNTNVAMLGESFKYVAPVAGALGYSVEDTAIALGLMANQGIKASQSGTVLRGLLSNLSNPVGQVATAVDALGLSLEHGDGRMKTLMEVMQDLRKSFGQGHMDANEFADAMSELQQTFDDGKISEDEYAESVENLMVAMYGAEGAQKAQYASMLAGKTGMAGLLAIVGTAEDDFKKLSESIYNASGTSQEMADIMQDNLSGQITIMLSALQELAIQFGEILLPVIKDVVEWLQNMIAKLQAMSPEQKEQIARWAALLAILGPVLLVFGKFVTTAGTVITAFSNIPGAISKVSSGFNLLKGSVLNVYEGFQLASAGFPALGAQASKLGAAIAGITAPMAAVVAAITVVVAAVVTLWNTNEDFRKRVIAIWDDIKNKFAEFGQGIVDRLNALGFDFGKAVEVIKAIWVGFCDLLAPIFIAAFEVIGSTLGAVLDVLLGVLDIFIGVFTGNWSQVWLGVKEIFGATLGGMVDLFTSVMEAIKGVATVVLGWFGTTWEVAWGNVSRFFIEVWTAFDTTVREVVNSILNTVKSVFTTILNTIRTINETIFNTMNTVWYNILYMITLIIMAIKDVIKNVFEAIKAFLQGNSEETKNRLNDAWNTIRNYISSVVETIRATIKTVFEAIKTTITTIMSGIQSVITNVWTGIRNTIDSITNGIKNTISTAWNSIKTTMTNISNEIKNSVTRIFESLRTSVSSAISGMKSSVVNIMTETKNGAIAVWDGITGTFENIGVNIIQGLINGIRSMVSKLYDAIYNALSDLVDKAKDALDIESPSKRMRDEVGRWLPPGIAEGFESAMGKATRDMQRSLTEGVDSLDGGDVSVGIQDNMIASMSYVADYYEAVETRLADAVASMRDSLEFLLMVGMAAINGASLGYIGYGGAVARDTRSDDTAMGADDRGSSGGNTYVFYTTKAIDEIEAARQMRMTERDIAEGFA